MNPSPAELDAKQDELQKSFAEFEGRWFRIMRREKKALLINLVAAAVNLGMALHTPPGMAWVSWLQFGSGTFSLVMAGRMADAWLHSRAFHKWAKCEHDGCMAMLNQLRERK